MRKLPANSTGSCGRMVNLDLRSCKPNFVTSSPSIVILPEEGSRSRNTEYVKEDFPAPVLPTIPTWRRQENKFVYSAVGVVINRIIFVSANADSVFDMFCFGAKFSVFVAKNAHIF